MNQVFKLISLVAAIYLVFHFVSIPIRRQVSDRFLARGQANLAARNYNGAVDELNQALSFNKENKKASELLELTKLIAKDITQGLEYFEKENKEVARKIKEADQGFVNPREALLVAVKYLRMADYQIALVAARRAEKLDPAYPEVWRIEELIYQRLSKSCPTKAWPDCQKYYQGESKKAHAELIKIYPLAGRTDQDE